MSFTNILLATAEFAFLIPFVIMCFAPVKDRCKIKSRLFAPVAITMTAIASVLCGIVKIVFNLQPYLLFILVLVVMLFVYLMLIDHNKLKLLFIFVSLFTVLSFVFSSSILSEALLNKNSKRFDILTYGLIVEWAITTLFVVAYFLCINKIRWLIKDYHLNSIWKAVWLVPAFIAIANCYMMPRNYTTLFIGKVAEIYVVITLVLVFLFVLFQVVLYVITKVITDKIYAEQQSQILRAQAVQYKTLKKYIEDTSRLRHDFLHTASTAVTLAQNNEKEALVKLLEEYGVSVKKSHYHKIFCEHDALNAVIAYYYDNAKAHNIECNWQIAISKDIGISDIDLCSVVGNLLNNAIQGALTAPDGNRYITFKADIEINNDVYIVVSNSFDGVIKKENGKYSTTKSNGHGIGLESIQTTVNKYHGFVKFYNDNENFYTDIMMQQDR